MSDRGEARRAVIIAFRNKCIGGATIAGAPLGEAKIKYRGQFPYQSVSDAVDAPADVKDHHRAWGQLYRMFDEEWRNFLKDTA